MSASSSKGIFLEVDPTIVENKLRFAADPKEEEFNKIFQPLNEEYPSKSVRPFPGFCVKSFEVGSDTKVFINICHTDAIPAPRDVSEKELQDILDSEDASNYRVPMSIGQIRTETDKKGEEVKVCDIAIHPDFYKKVETSPLFKSFFITLATEGMKDKYGIVTTDQKIVLKNRKAFGTLQVHRIQQREVERKMKEVGGDGGDGPRPVIETISSTQFETRVPEYRLFRRKTQPNYLIGEFKFPDVISAKELTLDVGEDRIVLESTSKNYLLDVFVPHVIRQNSCTSSFDKTTKILTVTMPLVGG